jgi:hypothetical protein
MLWGLHSLKKLLPDCCAALLLRGTSGPRKDCQYLLPLFGAAMFSFGAAMVSLPGVTLS